MKSLEALKNIKREAGVPYFSTLYDIDMWKEDFETIKQDLEVLEILRKHLKCIYNGYGGELSYYEIRCIHLDDYNEKNQEDFNKVKQWLEENENVD